METKLTLRMDEKIIERVKVYAQAHERSVSGLTEDLYKQLLNEEEFDDGRLSATVRKYRGILKGNEINETHDRIAILTRKHA